VSRGRKRLKLKLSQATPPLILFCDCLAYGASNVVVVVVVLQRHAAIVVAAIACLSYR
jgi:hypothetical protein